MKVVKREESSPSIGMIVEEKFIITFGETKAVPYFVLYDGLVLLNFLKGIPFLISTPSRNCSLSENVGQ